MFKLFVRSTWARVLQHACERDVQIFPDCDTFGGRGRRGNRTPAKFYMGRL